MEHENNITPIEEATIPQPENACETLDTVIQSRRKFRSLLFHVLYAVDAFNDEVSAREVAMKLNDEYDAEIELNGQIVTIVDAIIKHKDQLDATLVPHLQNWKFERIGKCTLLVLRYAIWELLNTDTPQNIIINEAVELAKCFSEKDAYKFVNGILDKISSQLREAKDTDNANEVTEEIEVTKKTEE